MHVFVWVAVIPPGHGQHSKPVSIVASNPGLPRPDFISQPRQKSFCFVFLHGCEIKSGQGRSGFEATSIATS